MSKLTYITIPILILLTSLSFAEDEVEVEHKPFKVWGVQEAGRIEGGIDWSEQNFILKDEWVDRIGAAISKEAIVNERLRIAVGIGLVFQFPKPEKANTKFGGSQYKIPYVGPSVAEAVYSFGDVEKPFLQLGTGAFPYKYNPQAYNLGENLYRTTGYPTSLTTGGLTTINSAGVQLQGFKALFDFGAFKWDVFLTTETSLPPFYDWSVSTVASYSIADGLFEIGAGVNLRHIIPINADSTTPKNFSNAYFDVVYDDTLGNPVTETISGWIDYYRSRKDVADNYVGTDLLRKPEHVNPTYHRDTSVTSMLENVFKVTKNNVPPDENMMRLDSVNAQYYTNTATILMARAALDIKKLFDSEMFNPEDLKLYVEYNVLGLKNYPVFYENRNERSPVMFGFNLPTFKLLDLFAIQVEYLNSPYLNNHEGIGRGNTAVPAFKSHPSYNPNDEFFGVTKDDNLYWSILIQKNLLPGVQLSAQIARDHYRAIAPNVFYGSRQEANETLFRGKDWYWLFQLSWGM